MPGRLVRSPLLWLAVTLAAFFNQELFFGKVFSPADWLFRASPWSTVRPPGWARPANDLRTDEVLIGLPRMLQAARDLSAHGLTLWQQHTLVGTENTLSLHELGTFVWPPMWTFFLLSAGSANTVTHLLVPVLAGLSMIALTRVLGLGRQAQAMASISWALNGYLVVWLSAVGLPLTMAALPLLVALAVLLVRDRSLWAGLAFSLLYGWTFFFAYPPANILLTAAVAAMVAFQLAASIRRRLAGTVWLAGFAALGAGIAGVAIVTAAAELGPQAAVGSHFILGPLPAWAARVLLLPNFYGSPVTADWYAPSRVDLNFLEVTGYFGIVGLGLAAGGAVLLLWRRPWWALAALALALLSLLLAFGIGPFGIESRVPLLSSVRPGRWLIVFDFGAILLAAHCLESIGSRARDNAVAVASLAFAALLAAVLIASARPSLPAAALRDSELRVALAVAAAIAVGFAWRRRSAWAGPALVALAAVDLVSFGSSFNPAIPARQFYPTTPAISYLQAHSAGFRTLVATPDEMLFGGDVMNVYGIDSVTGYDHFRHQDLVALLGSSVDPWDRQEWAIWGFLELGGSVDYDSPVWSRLGVRYAYLPLGPGSVPPPRHWSLVYQGPDGAIFENHDVLSALFTVAPGESPVSFPHTPDAPDHDSAAVLGPTLLVWSHAAGGGWKVSIDGRDVKPAIYDGYFLAASVPSGEHRVEARYAPRDYALGGVVTLAAAGVWVLAAAGLLVSSRRRPSLRGRRR